MSDRKAVFSRKLDRAVNETCKCTTCLSLKYFFYTVPSDVDSSSGKSDPGRNPEASSFM